MVEVQPSNEIHIVRVYNAPLDRVWSAWSQHDEVAQWWGPRGFTITTRHKDLVTGGHWHYTMHGPDGIDYPNITHYLKVEPRRELIYDHGANEHQPPMFRVAVLFHELEQKPPRTQIDITMLFESAAVATQTAKYIKDAGGDATWDRLAEHLEKQISGKEIFVINRSFDAPLERVFQAWTQPEQFSQWVPPVGFSMEFLRPAIFEGGDTYYFMAEEGGTKLYGKNHYSVIEKPNRLVYTQQFSDEHEGLSQHRLAPIIWPETTLTTVEFMAEEAHRTRVKVTWEPHGPHSTEELEAFVVERPGMTIGWTSSFNKLDSLLNPN